MESTGEANKIHCSAQCVAVLKKLGGYYVAERGVVHLKGKGDIATYWVNEKENLAEELLLVPPIPATESHPKILDLYTSNRLNGHASHNPLNVTKSSDHSLNQSEEKAHRKVSTVKSICKRLRLNSIARRRTDSDCLDGGDPPYVSPLRRGSDNVLSMTHSRERNFPYYHVSLTSRQGLY